MIVEQGFNCPYCGESISVLIDASICAQQYIEDCEVCCQPIDIEYVANDKVIESFTCHRGDE